METSLGISKMRSPKARNAVQRVHGLRPRAVLEGMQDKSLTRGREIKVDHDTTERGSAFNPEVIEGIGRGATILSLE